MSVGLEGSVLKQLDPFHALGLAAAHHLQECLEQHSNPRPALAQGAEIAELGVVVALLELLLVDVRNPVEDLVERDGLLA
eukprot:13728121-Alexandrium_andersonii.AAC.1